MIAIIAILVLAAIALVFYMPDTFEGDGTLTDRGFFGSSRFVLSFKEINLRDTREYIYWFKGFPASPITIGLRLSPPSECDSASGLTNSVEFTL